MIKGIEQLEQERQAIYSVYAKNSRISIIFIIAGAAIAILSALFGETVVVFGIIIGMILFVIGIIFGAIASSKSRPFTKKFKLNLIKALLEEMYQNVYYNPEDSLNLSRVLATGLVKQPDRYKGEDLVTCEYKGVKIQACDFHMEERHVTYDSKGNRHVSYQTYFKGRWLIFKFDEAFKDQVRILEKSWLGFSIAPKGFKKVETESIAFNKKFLMESTDPQHAFYIVTPSMIEKLLEFESMMGGTVSLLYRGDELHIAINNNSNSLEPRLKYPLNEENLKRYQSETDLMAVLINEFGLSKDKYMND